MQKPFTRLHKRIASTFDILIAIYFTAVRSYIDLMNKHDEVTHWLEKYPGYKLGYKIIAHDKHRPVIVLVHGLASNHTRWPEFIANTTLLDRFNCLRVDLMGHGLSLQRQRVRSAILCRRKAGKDSRPTKRIIWRSIAPAASSSEALTRRGGKMQCAERSREEAVSGHHDGRVRVSSRRGLVLALDQWPGSGQPVVRYSRSDKLFFIPHPL